MTIRTIHRANLAVRRDVTLGTIIDRLADVHGDRSLVEEADGGIRCTYRQARKRVDRWAGGIRAEVEPGDRVVLATPNEYEQLLLCVAAAKAGAIPVPVNDQMRPDEIAHVVADSGAGLTVRSARRFDDARSLRTPAPADADDVAALFYTSGTTGKPKGVELTHRSLVGQLIGGVLWPARLRRDEAVVSLPIAHIMGFISLLGFASAGIPVYFIPHFRPDVVLDAIEDRRASVFVGVPAMYRLLLEAGAGERDLTSVRLWASGADVMPQDLAVRFKQMGATATLPVVGSVGEAMFAEGYGMVEVGGGAAAKISPPFLETGLGESLGFSLPGYSFRVVDEHDEQVPSGDVGELWIRGPGMLRGYWNAPEVTASVLTDDGWLRTGDLARRGPFGTVMFVGRDKDVIMHGGYTVYALEVQEALEQHHDVLEAAVTGLPDERLGEIPVAAVRMAGDATTDAEGLRTWLSDHLAEYKVPVRIVAVDELPRTGTRKVQKSTLRAMLAG